MLEAVNGLCSMGLIIKLIAFYCIRFRGKKGTVIGLVEKH